MKKTSLRQAAMKLALVACVLLAPFGLRAQQSLPYSYGFENNDLSADGWTTQNPSGLNASEFGIKSSAKKTGSYGFRFSSYNDNGTNTQYLISPELSAAGGVVVQFYYKGSSSSGDEVFKVGYSTTGTNISDFTFGSEIATEGNTSWTLSDEFTFPAGTKYVAIYYYANYQYRLYVDDFTYEPAQQGGTPKPTGFAVSNILHNQADLSWNENGTATSWQICVNGDEENLITATTNPFTLTGLTPLTAYTVKVRSVGSPNSDWSTSKSFNTAAVATVVGDEWSDDFEGVSCGWELVNGTNTNKWCWGTATNNGGTHAIYVSNDDGATTNYSDSGTKIFATKLLQFADGKYEFSYDWLCKGESSYDFLRVALVPASQTLTAGTDYSTIGTTSLPSGWIALDGGGKLNLQTSWQSKSATINVAAGNYYMVLVWRNDSDVYPPAAAVDNVSITRVACPYDVAGLAVSNIETDGATLTWTAGEATQWQVATKTGDADWVILPSIYNTNSAALTGLTATTTYQVKARAYCNANDQGTWCDPISLTTACPPVYPLDYTCGFEGPNTTGSYQLPLCWTRMGSSTSYPYISSSNYHGGTHSLYFYTKSGTSYRNEIAALPAIDAELNTIRVSFYGKVSSSTSDNNINIGYVTDLNDPETFTLVETVTLTTSHEKYTVSFRNVSDNNGYIAIQSSYSSVTKYIYIDDITVEEIPSCVEPSALQFVSSTTSTANIQWTAVGNETSWDIYYSTENVAPTTQTGTNTSDNPATIAGLTASTTYYVWVRAHCSDADQSPWIGGISFATECAAFTVDAEHHYTENFNNYTAATGTSALATYPDDKLPLCWQFLNRSDNSSNYPQAFLSSSSNYAVSGNCLFFKSSSSTPLYAILPEFTSNISDLMLTFTYRNEGTNASNGTLYVSYMTDPTDASTFNTANAIACDRTTTKTEKEVFFPNAPAGSYIAFKYQGGSSDSYYLSIDNVSVEPAPTCRKPSALTLDSRTAHTATLHWTNGEVGQTAWQVSYSTNANFDPADGTIVDVDANPGTISGLAQSTTYYAYVRANCGNSDYSAWNSTKVTFTTIAGNMTPTGLTVDNSTITSSQATASWTPRDGNTLHESYDIYWALASVEAVPLEPAAPNLIAGITETSQVISGLEAETTYKVWVRDNCGTDGYSNWSSTPCTFMTAAACQTPDGLAASNVTNNSATISWNTYGLTDFNLRYSTDGVNWTPVNDVNSPYAFNGTLSSNTAYQVQVQATCNTEAWSATTLNFKTECDAITITNEHHWTENFESPVVTTTYSQVGEMPDCWDNYPTTASSAKILAAGAQYNYADNSQVLYFYGSGNNYAALPVFSNALNELQITFKYATESASNGNLTLGYITAEDNGTYNTFTAIGSSYNASQSYYHVLTPITVYLNNVPAEATRLVFRWYYSSQYGANVDDIEVSPAPSCYPLGTLTHANVGTHSAELSWALVDNNQTAWQVQYATDENFTEGVNSVVADAHENYTLAGLTPEVHYWVRVRAKCGNDNYGDWSNVVDFTTGIACPAPTALTLDASTTETLTISWTGSADTWIVAYKEAESAGDFTIATEDATNPYTITGLEDGTFYTVKVRANCGNVNGLSQWSATGDFQTEASCPSPYDLAVTDASETAHGATITWDGNVDNDSYTVEYAEGPLTVPTTLLEESFDGDDMPTGWSIMDLGTSNWSVSNTDYAGGDANELNLNYDPSFNGTSRLVTPAIDLTGISEVTFTFKHYFDHYSGSHTLGIATSSDGGTTWNDGWSQSYSASTSGTISEVISTSDMGNANVLFCIYYTGNSYNINDWYFDDITITAEVNPTYTWNTLQSGVTGNSYTINTLDPETDYVVRVKGVCSSTPSPASNIVGFTTLEACGAPTAFTLGAVEAHQATFSWTAGIANTAWKVYVKEHGAAEYPVAYTNANTASVTIDGLEANTAYDVKIVPTCNESKILEVENAFTTPCEATVVDIDHPFTESFDVNTFPPSDCWDTIKAGTRAWSRSTSQHHTGDASAYSGYYGDIYLILPDLAIADESADVLLKFWSYNNYTSSYDKNSVVLLEGNNETELWTTAEVSQQWVESTVDLSAYKGQTVSIAFKYEGSNAHGWYIDDVTVGFFHTINATASPVAGGTVTGGNTYLHGASVTLTATPNAGYQFVNWTKGGVEQSTNTSYSFTASEDADYVANFANVYTKTITADKWYAISSPVHNSGDDQTLAGVTNLTSGSYDLFGFTESAGTWNKPPTVLEQGKGYIYRAADAVTLSFVGTPNSGDISYDLSYEGADNNIKGFNLVGNPFPQAATPGMVCYSLTPSGTWHAELASYEVPICEAVLVKTDGTVNEVSFNTGGGAKGVMSTPAITFTVSNEKYEDVAYVRFDNGDELPKIGHLEPNAPALSIPVNGKQYAIANLDSDCESFVMNFSGMGDYTISASGEVAYLHLIDKVTGSDIDLLSQPTYSFKANMGDLSSRFLVKLVPNGKGITDGDFAFRNGNGWTVEGEGTLEAYDAMGRLLFAQEISSSSYQLSTSHFPSAGVYILRLGGNSQKIVVTK